MPYGLPEAADRGVLALQFVVPFYEFFNVVSALESSPWTISKVGANPEAEKDMTTLLWHATFIGNGAALAGVVIGGSWLPVAGSGAATVYCWWLYKKWAIGRAREPKAGAGGQYSGAGAGGLSWGNPT
ncbi:MAG TPA: hypothetical protein VKS82_27285 [Streptosporangiaceae bacterium]|nr:hypothetical protein [Streptosporangiaceae bacterium]